VPVWSQLRLNDGIRNLQLSYVVLLPTALIAGPIFGLFSVSLVSWFARIISDGLDGAATEHETQASLAWSLLPEIYTLPLTLLMAIIAAPDTGSSNASLVRAVMIWHLAVSSAARAWSLVLWIFALAEVNRFSKWRALAAVLVTTFALVVAAVLVIAAFYLFGILLGG
jgi:Yip1 domain